MAQTNSSNGHGHSYKRRARPDDLQDGRTVYERTWTRTGSTRWLRGRIQSTDGRVAWVYYPDGRRSLLPFSALWVDTYRNRESLRLREELSTLTALRDSIDAVRAKRIANLESRLEDERRALADDRAFAQVRVESVIARLARLNALREIG